MTDLTTRLRSRAHHLTARDMNGDEADLALDAAKRIEALEKTLWYMTDLVRSHASKTGSLCAWWDSIMDAEKVLKGTG